MHPEARVQSVLPETTTIFDRYAGARRPASGLPLHVVMQRAGGREIKIEFRRLTEVDPADMIRLANDPLVRRHMPLSSGTFGEAEFESFVADKERLWEEHGYGPWAFYVDGEFAGWGGLQAEDGDADVALVLHPDY